VVLKKVAQIINSTCELIGPPEDILVARYGGEEFIVLMRNTDIIAANELMETVRKNIEASEVEEEGDRIKYTVSIGISEFPSTSSNINQAVKDSDSALYRAKTTGRNRTERALSPLK
jgi:diguanylate cyclase (GGDEF)-like protein